MNIAFYLLYTLNCQNGGIERLTHLVAQELIRVGHNVFYISYISEANEEYQSNRLVLPDSEDLCSQQNQDCLADFVKKNQIDILVAQHSYDMQFATLPYLIKQQTGLKIIYGFHTSPYINSLLIADTSRPIIRRKRTFIKEWKRIWRIILREKKKKSRDCKMGAHFNRLHDMGDAIMVSCDKYVDDILAISDIKSRKKLFAIPNPNTYTEDTILEMPKENTVLFVGRLSEEKRPEKVLVIWSRIQDKFPEWNLKMLGDGKERFEIEKLHRKLRLQRCHIEGKQEPTPYYAKAKILLMTSDFEGFPMTIPEAMQHGLVPVIFNSFGSLSYLIEDNVSGISVTPYDLKEFEEKLSALMSNQAKIVQMSEEAKKSIRKLSVENVVDKWLEMFRKI